ncbi:hypothetical protein [Arthrobacter alpinus]|uniref:hypothetical protein n=1 Tax=Arthrobacter alpinus TaxID=656366 RepID=UPI00164626DA|nr:hypothetical protein [Arthrobacter alpinus]
MTTMTAVRLGLGILGIAGVAFGAYSLLAHLGPTALFGLAAWLAAAVLLHDGVLVPLTTVAGHGVRRMGGNLQPLSRNLIRGALMMGAVLTLVVVPLLAAQQRNGNPPINNTVLQGNYGSALAILWGILAFATAASVSAVEHYARGVKRQISRS